MTNYYYFIYFTSNLWNTASYIEHMIQLRRWAGGI